MSASQRVLSVLLFALAALATGSVHARPGGPGKHGGKLLNPKHFDRLAEELQIAPEVQAALRVQLEAARAEGKAAKQTLRAENQALHAMLAADAPDRVAVMAQLDKIGALRLTLHKIKVGTMIDLRAALTPEQRAKLKAKMEARRARRGKRGRKGRRGRRGRPEPGFEPPPGE